MMGRVRCRNRKGKDQIPINNNTQKRYSKQGITHISLRIESFVHNESSIYE
jgi:hypothetical protein